MKRWERRLFHASTAVVAASGVLYFWMKYAMESNDPFSIVNHPWQPGMLAAHVLAAPVLVFVTGLIADSHVRRKLRSGARSNRSSGVLSLIVLFPMIVSGYLLQVLTGPLLIRIMIVVHVGSSFLFVVTYVVHQVVSFRLRKPAAPPAARMARTSGVRRRRFLPPSTLPDRPVALLLAGALFATVGEAVPVQIRRQVYLMGTTATLDATAPDRESGIRRLEHLIRILEGAEEQLSTWRPASALSRLNHQETGVPFSLDRELCRLLPELKTWQARTGGAFDPAIGALIEAWGFPDSPREPGPRELEDARRRSGLDQLQVDPAACEATRLGDIRIDAGAFGKGEALDRILAASGDGFQVPSQIQWMADLGGQIMVYQAPGAGASWTVDLAHPGDRAGRVLTLTLTGGSLATSGGSQRDVETPDGRIGHILDPRTGRTVSRPESVVVWHARGLIADILSTALYVMGVEEGLRWAEDQGVAACFLVPDGETVRCQATTAFRELFLR